MPRCFGAIFSRFHWSILLLPPPKRTKTSRGSQFCISGCSGYVYRPDSPLRAQQDGFRPKVETPGDQQTGTVHGFVEDAATGAPLSRVLVADVTGEESGPSVVTGPDGAFELAVPPGARRLRASVVGYSVAERLMTVTVGASLTRTVATGITMLQARNLLG